MSMRMLASAALALLGPAAAISAAQSAAVCKVSIAVQKSAHVCVSGSECPPDPPRSTPDPRCRPRGAMD